MSKAAVQQKVQEEFLKQREEELAEREIELVERELNIMILQQIMNKPTPKKRKGKFKKQRLKLLRSGGKNISQPSGDKKLNPFFLCSYVTRIFREISGKNVRLVKDYMINFPFRFPAQYNSAA